MAIALIAVSLRAAEAVEGTRVVPTPGPVAAELAELSRSAITGDIPAAFQADYGEFHVSPKGEPVDESVIGLWRGRLPVGAVETTVLFDGHTYLLSSVLDGGAAGLLVVNHAASRRTPEVLTPIGAVAARYVTTPDRGTLASWLIVDADGNIVATRSESSSATAAAGDNCNCALARTALYLWLGTCAAVALEAPPAWIFCAPAAAATADAVNNYCVQCAEQGEVSLTPKVAYGWQDTSHGRTNWSVQYNPPHLSDRRVEMVWRTTLVYGTPPHKADNYVASFQAQHDCCKSTDKQYDVEAWVSFEDGSSGIAYGKWVVYKFG